MTANSNETRSVSHTNGDKDHEHNSTAETKSDKTRDLPAGSTSAAKNIYKSATDDDGNWTWVDKFPEDAEEAAENEETAQYAVIVRNVKSQDSRKKLEAHSIVIQSPWLKTALSVVLDDYPGVACELKRLTFEAPFQPFLHRWVEFVEYMQRRDLDDKTREHLVILHDILKYEIGDNIKAFEDYVQNGVITFGHLWMIFQPGSVVLAAHNGPLSAFEFTESEYMENRCGKFLRLRCDCVDYDGKDFARGQEVIDVSEFLGTKKILGLKAYPLVFHEEKETIMATLAGRGQIFENLAGHHYKQYSGTAITWDRDGNEVPIQVSGRIIVDIDSFNRFSPYRVRDTADWTAKDLQMLQDYKETLKCSTDDTLRLTPYHQMLARSRTRGYSLKLKKWLDFFVEQVAEIVWNSTAFDRLVLPEDQKDLILAFSESQLAGSSFDDVISGKGRGIICLLSGPPGVGKTLTAEAVAENLHVPLHTLSSGDLGSNSWSVEQELNNVLELVARWNAILLLDECDVFLEARSQHDLERNKVVSIFLRTLEYYQGILFMTTNRVDNIDAAFQSRIHVSLEYPDLSPVSRRVIWQNFLGTVTLSADISDKDLDQLAELDLNGRQIKNILKIAQLLASKRKSLLTREVIDTVLAIEKRRPDMKPMA